MFSLPKVHLVQWSPSAISKLRSPSTRQCLADHIWAQSRVRDKWNDGEPNKPRAESHFYRRVPVRRVLSLSFRVVVDVSSRSFLGFRSVNSIFAVYWIVRIGVDCKSEQAYAHVLDYNSIYIRFLCKRRRKVIIKHFAAWWPDSNEYICFMLFRVLRCNRLESVRSNEIAIKSSECILHACNRRGVKQWAFSNRLNASVWRSPDVVHRTIKKEMF